MTPDQIRTMSSEELSRYVAQKAEPNPKQRAPEVDEDGTIVVSFASQQGFWLIDPESTPQAVPRNMLEPEMTVMLLEKMPEAQLWREDIPERGEEIVWGCCANMQTDGSRAETFAVNADLRRVVLEAAALWLAGKENLNESAM